MLPEEDDTGARDDAYRTLFEHWPDAVFLFDGNRRIIEANRAARERSAVELTELLARRKPLGSTLADFFTALDAGEGATAEARLVDRAGVPRVLVLRGLPLTPDRYAVIARDVTAERDLATSFAQMRRVDSLGLATASIVHDFNNILTPIVALSTLVANELDGASRFAGFAEEIQAASTRAVALVRQLQSFVRRNPNRPTRVNPPVALMEMRPLLERVAGETIDVELALADLALETMVDRDQLEQVVLNLVANARDAMPRGGRLTIGVQHAPCAAQVTDGDGSGAATYVAVSVTDTGMGMAPEIRRRVFERFFTTKPHGLGTGFGLASAHRFAVEHGGSISVESQEGHGTTVTVYLPYCERAQAPKSDPPEPAIPRGKETILVVDDDAGVRRAATIVLERHGYRVLSAGSAAEALELASRAPVIHLLVTDVVLPRIDGPASAPAEGSASGPALASALARLRPGVKVLFMSGHTDAVLEANGIAETTDVLQKGFLPTELACAVRSALNRT